MHYASLIGARNNPVKPKLTDLQRKLLLELSDGEWQHLYEDDYRVVKSLVKRDLVARVEGEWFYITTAGRAALGVPPLSEIENPKPIIKSGRGAGGGVVYVASCGILEITYGQMRDRWNATMRILGTSLRHVGRWFDSREEVEQWIEKLCDADPKDIWRIADVTENPLKFSRPAKVALVLSGISAALALGLYLAIGSTSSTGQTVFYKNFSIATHPTTVGSSKLWAAEFTWRKQVIQMLAPSEELAIGEAKRTIDTYLLT